MEIPRSTSHHQPPPRPSPSTISSPTKLLHRILTSPPPVLLTSVAVAASLLLVGDVTIPTSLQTLPLAPALLGLPSLGSRNHHPRSGDCRGSVDRVGVFEEEGGVEWSGVGGVSARGRTFGFPEDSVRGLVARECCGQDLVGLGLLCRV